MKVKQIKKIYGFVCLATAFLMPAVSVAAEITAVDFNGNVLGQVISTGMVISADGQDIGTITADSFVINPSGELIGGIVPQGIVIGNDNKLLGKIHGDGVVRSFSGKNLGKALPNGLVVDDDYAIIGTILFPGLIYSDEGTIVGRMTGIGTYVDLDGQELGFVSANGIAYRKDGSTYVIAGRLMSSKMVVSLDGKFMGSIAPSGKVIDFEGKEIADIHANGYAYSSQSQIVGRIILSGYAFDLNGRYLGFVSYNGAVINQEKEVGYYRADGNIVDDKNKVIGFFVSASATVNDEKGNYVGRLLPSGIVVKQTQKIGKIGAAGKAYNDNGEQIGQLINVGPVFDALGKFKGEGMRNGSVVSLGGSNIGHVLGSYAYDTNAMMLGGFSSDIIAFNLANKALGISGIGATTGNGAEKNKVTPFGYVYNNDGKLFGQSIKMGATYSLTGNLYSYITPNGNLYRGLESVRLMPNGTLLNKEGYAGDLLSSYYSVGFSGSLGYKNADNTIADKQGDKAYKIIPQNYVVPFISSSDQNVMPISGYAGSDVIAVSIGGDLLGYATDKGTINNLNGTNYGRVINDGYVVDNNNAVTGRVIPFVSVNNDKCASIGVVNGNGDVVNSREVIIGRMITNGQVISDVGSYIGYSVWEKGLIDFDGNFAGIVANGSGMDYEGQNIGCINRNGIITDGDGQWKYGVIRETPVINFSNKVIGQVLADGSVADAKSKIVGFVQPNGNAVTKSKNIIGQAMRYKVAFNNQNEFMGMVQNSGAVADKDGKNVGWINYDGSVMSNGEIVGYALYDFYVYDDKFSVYGYITKDGAVLSSVGSKLGNIDKGFVVDKSGSVVARGNRDYTIRDDKHNSIGELAFDGSVIDYNGKNVGYISDGGAIKNTNADTIAQAYPLQYYLSARKLSAENSDWADRKKVGIQEEVVKTTTDTQQQVQDDKSGNLSKKIIGIALSPNGDILGDIYEDNSVIDSDGTQVGYRTPEGMIVDMEYNPIGIEEIQKTSAETMFIPAGAFGNGNAYGIGSHPSNLGPGGGYGQGERYSPERARALAQLQQRRRANLSVGELKTSGNRNISTFTGYEEDGWGGQKNISSWRVDMSEMILQDKPIPAVLARSVYASDGMGTNIPITAIVERNIYAEEGRNIIIPAGSRVIGSLAGTTSTGGNSGGAVKIGITWNRLIRPDGAQFILGNAQTADAQGRAGAIGYLDQQLLKKYTTPLMTSMLQSFTAYMIAAGKGSSTSDGVTTTDSKSEAANQARETFLEKTGQIFEDIMEEKANIRAVTYIPAGTRIIIFPNEDLWLNSVDRALKEESNVAERQRSSNSGLLDKDPAGSSTGSSGNGGGGSANATGDEEVVPAASLVDKNPNGSSRRRQQNVPASTTQQGASGPARNQETSAVPDLL